MAGHAREGIVVLALRDLIHEQFQLPLALKSGLGAFRLLILAIAFLLAGVSARHPTVLVHAIVLLVPLPSAVGFQEIAHIRKYLLDILVEHVTQQQGPA